MDSLLFDNGPLISIPWEAIIFNLGPFFSSFQNDFDSNRLVLFFSRSDSLSKPVVYASQLTISTFIIYNP